MYKGWLKGTLREGREALLCLYDRFREFEITAESTMKVAHWAFDESMPRGEMRRERRKRANSNGCSIQAKEERATENYQKKKDSKLGKPGTRGI